MSPSRVLQFHKVWGKKERLNLENDLHREQKKSRRNEVICEGKGSYSSWSMLILVFYARPNKVKKHKQNCMETKNKNCQVHAIISFVSFHYPILTFNYLSNWSSIPISLSSFIPKSSPTQKQRKWEQESHAEIIARKFYSLFFFSFLLNCGFGNGCCCHCNSLMKTLQACMHRGVYEAVKCKKQLFYSEATFGVARNIFLQCFARGPSTVAGTINRIDRLFRHLQ